MQTSWAMHNRRGGKLSTKQIKRGSCAPSRRPHKAASYVCPLRIFGVESMQRIRGGSFQVIQMCNLLSWDSFLTSLINSRGLDINAHISIFFEAYLSSARFLKLTRWFYTRARETDHRHHLRPFRKIRDKKTCDNRLKHRREFRRCRKKIMIEFRDEFGQRDKSREEEMTTWRGEKKAKIRIRERASHGFRRAQNQGDRFHYRCFQKSNIEWPAKIYKNLV